MREDEKERVMGGCDYLKQKKKVRVEKGNIRKGNMSLLLLRSGGGGRED